MEYHSDRFVDHSLLCHNDRGELLAVLPANREDSVLISHNGLTFGGLIMAKSLKFESVVRIFECISDYMRNNGLIKLIYKKMPNIYSRIPSDEDVYALYLEKANLQNIQITSSIRLNDRIAFQKLRSRQIKKAHSAGIQLLELDRLDNYWKLLSSVLYEQHKKTPVHSVSEINALWKLFPNNIIAYGAFLADRLIAGVIIYLSGNVAHVQYIASGSEGKKVGALDALFDFLINKYTDQKEYFDFGVSSTGVDTDPFNRGLLSQKQGFGARAILHQIYELDIK